MAHRSRAHIARTLTMPHEPTAITLSDSETSSFLVSWSGTPKQSQQIRAPPTRRPPGTHAPSQTRLHQPARSGRRASGEPWSAQTRVQPKPLKALERKTGRLGVTWYVGTGPKHTRTASQPPWDPLGHITPAAKSLPHEGEGLRTQRQVRPVRWLHVTRSSVDRLTRKARQSAPAKNRLMVAKACESDLILETYA